MNTTTTDLDQMFTNIKTDFQGSIDEYRKHSENMLYGWALEMDQKIAVNGSEMSADIDDDEIRADIITCPLDGKLTLVHCFEAETFVPLGNTPFEIQPVKPGTYYGYNNDGPAYKGTIGESGSILVELDAATYGGKQLQITFYPDVTKDDVKTLLDSYDSTLDKLTQWLEKEWETQKKAWQAFLDNPIDVWDEVKKFLHSMVNELIKAWDEIAELFDLLAHPTKLAKMLSKYMENPELIAKMLQDAKDEAVKMLMLLKDEARCFLCIKAVYSWIRMLSPTQILNFIGTSLAAILVEVILMLIIPGGAVLKNVNRVRDVAGYASMVG